ncbi:MAG: hypothetical protein V7727_15525 [Sneathiella sp.]
MRLEASTRFSDKRVAEKKLIGIDWTASLKGAAIEAAVWTTELTKTGEDFTAEGQTTAFVSGGVAGKDYPVVIKITTDGGEVLEVEVPLRVV